MVQTKSESKKKKSPRLKKTLGDRSPWHLLKQPIKHLTEHYHKSSASSDYKGRAININDVRLWEDFITVEDVESLWKNSPEMKKAISRNLTPKIAGRCIWEEPVSKGMRNEMCLEREWGSIQDQLNLVAEILAKAVQKTENPKFVKMGDGSNAEWVSPNAEIGANKKRPDYSGFLYKDDAQFLDDGPSQVCNRIPGDAKLFRKIYRDLLPPNGKKYKPGRKNIQARRALNQIHGYMDQREARYGYIINNEELIFFRRRDTGWGQLDISEAILHNVEADAETGVLNSKYALFYFHWVIAKDDSSSGWRLRSFGSDPAPTPSDSSSAELVNAFKRAKVHGRTSIMRKFFPNAANWRENMLQWVSKVIEIL